MNEQIKKLRAKNALHDAYGEEWAWADALRNGRLSDLATRKRFLNDQGGTEDANAFTQRAKLTDYSPDTPRIVERVTNVVWSEEPRRDFADAALKDFIDRAGPDGEPLEDMAREAAQDCSWKRYALLLMDRPVFDPAAVKNRADEKAQGVDLPYFALYPAERILDWRADGRGKLIYVRVTSSLRREDDTTQVEEIREIDLKGITLWKIITKKGDPEKLENLSPEPIPYSDGITAAKRLPVVVARWRKILGDPIDSRTPLIECMMAEMGAFHAISLHRWDSYLTGHPHLKWWKRPNPLTGPGQSKADANVSPNCYHELDPGDKDNPKEDMAWLEVQGTGQDRNWIAYLHYKQDILTKAGIDGRSSQPAPGKDAAGMANSAAQVQVEFEVGEGCTLKGLAALAEQIENDMVELVKLDRGITEDKAVEYRKAGFVGQAPERALSRAQVWQRGPQGEPVSPTYAKEAWKQAGKESFPNAPDELHKKAHAEIEKADMSAPEPPDLMGGAQPKKPGFPPAKLKPEGK
jgi:hypothetical protein